MNLLLGLIFPILSTLAANTHKNANPSTSCSNSNGCIVTKTITDTIVHKLDDYAQAANPEHAPEHDPAHPEIFIRRSGLRVHVVRDSVVENGSVVGNTPAVRLSSADAVIPPPPSGTPAISGYDDATMPLAETGPPQKPDPILHRPAKGNVVEESFDIDVSFSGLAFKIPLRKEIATQFCSMISGNITAPRRNNENTPTKISLSNAGNGHFTDFAKSKNFIVTVDNQEGALIVEPTAAVSKELTPTIAKEQGPDINIALWTTEISPIGPPAPSATLPAFGVHVVQKPAGEDDRDWSRKHKLSKPTDGSQAPEPALSTPTPEIAAAKSTLPELTPVEPTALSSINDWYQSIVSWQSAHPEAAATTPLPILEIISDGPEAQDTMTDRVSLAAAPPGIKKPWDFSSVLSQSLEGRDDGHHSKHTEHIPTNEMPYRQTESQPTTTTDLSLPVKDNFNPMTSRAAAPLVPNPLNLRSWLLPRSQSTTPENTAPMSSETEEPSETASIFSLTDKGSIKFPKTHPKNGKKGGGAGGGNSTSGALRVKVPWIWG